MAKSTELRQRKVQALPLEPLRPVVTSYMTQPTQNTITSLIATPLDIRTHMVFALFSGVMYLGSALRGVRWELVPKAALPCALDGRNVLAFVRCVLRVVRVVLGIVRIVLGIVRVGIALFQLLSELYPLVWELFGMCGGLFELC